MEVGFGHLKTAAGWFDFWDVEEYCTTTGLISSLRLSEEILWVSVMVLKQMKERQKAIRGLGLE